MIFRRPASGIEGFMQIQAKRPVPTHRCHRQTLDSYRKFSRTTERTFHTTTRANNDHCKDLVKKHDYESFLVSPFYPSHLHSGYFALKAFSVRSYRQTNWILQIYCGTMQGRTCLDCRFCFKPINRGYENAVLGRCCEGHKGCAQPPFPSHDD